MKDLMRETIFIFDIFFIGCENIFNNELNPLTE